MRTATRSATTTRRPRTSSATDVEGLVVAVVGPTATGKSDLAIDARAAAAAARSSAPTPPSSTAGWTSAPPRCRRGAARRPAPPARRARRDRGGQRRRVPAARAGRHRGRAGAAAPCPWSPAGRGSTCARRSTGSRSPRPTRRCGRPSRSELDREGVAALLAELRAADPRGRRRDRAEQRPPGRAGARGDRPDRAPVQRDDADPRVRAARPCCRAAHRPRGPRRPHRPSGRADVRRRAGRRDPRRCRRRPARGTHREPGGRLRPGARRHRRHDHARGCRRRHRAAHPAARAPPGVVVRGATPGRTGSTRSRDPGTTWSTGSGRARDRDNGAHG